MKWPTLPQCPFVNLNSIRLLAAQPHGEDKRPPTTSPTLQVSSTAGGEEEDANIGHFKRRMDCAGKRSLLLLSLSPPSGIKEEEAAAGCTFKERRRRRKKKKKERFGEEKNPSGLRPERSHRGSQPGTGSLASNISCLAL